MLLDPKDNCINCVVEPSQHSGGLFIGSVYATEADIIERHHIKAIISVMNEHQHVAQVDVLGTIHMVIALSDHGTSDLGQHFNDCCVFINEQMLKHNVLVHCLAGNSRSATIVLAYLMRSNQWSLSEALQHLKCARNTVKPNQGFLRQLETYQDSLK